jgi:hypothetical protein
MDGDDDDDDDDFGGSNGEEASLEDFDAKSGDDTNLEEGQEDAEVLEFEFDVEDSDVEVQRVEIVASSTGTEEDPWDVFESATLWMDGDDVATIDGLDDEDQWDEWDAADGGDVGYSFRFNGVDTVVDMGETAEFVVSVTLQDNLDNLPESWNLSVDDNGVRALDEAGIDQYIGDEDDTVNVDLEAAGGDDELTLSENTDNPDATTLEVDESDKSDVHTLAVMDLEADTDTEVKDFKFRVIINENQALDETYANVLSDLELVIDGEVYDDYTVAADTTATATVTFDLDGEDIVIEAGDEVAIEINAEFNATSSNYDEGTTVKVDALNALFSTIDAEGVDSGEDLTAGALKGSFTGDVHTLRSAGVALTSGTTEADVVEVDGAGNDRAVFSVEFEVTAFGEDFYVPFGAATSTAQSAEGVSYDLTDGSNAVVAGTGTTTASLDSSADEEDGAYIVREGETETFTLEVTYDPLTAGTYKAVLQQVFFRDEATTDANATGQEASPEAAYRTGSANIID